MIMLTQAFEISGKSDGLSEFSKSSIKKLRISFQPSKEDKTFYEDILAMRIELESGNLFKALSL